MRKRKKVMTKTKWAKLRKSLYGVAVAGGGILILHGVVTEEELEVYKVATEALLGLVGLAFFNVDTSSGDGDVTGPVE
jgi:hypothetical protein